MKYRNENTKSILRDAFKDKLPSDLLNQNFKQGLNKQYFQMNSKNKNFMLEIFNQNDFKNTGLFKHNDILADLSNNINLGTLWELCKSYLILSGFKNNLKNINFTDIKKEDYNYLKT